MLKNVYNSGIILTSVWKYSGYITNNKNKEQNIELLELKHMGTIHAKLGGKKKKAAAARPGQAGPNHWATNQSIHDKLVCSQLLSTNSSIQAQSTKQQPSYNFTLIAMLWRLCFTFIGKWKCKQTPQTQKKRRFVQFRFSALSRTDRGWNRALQDLKKNLLY